jgi:hypothetical protein
MAPATGVNLQLSQLEFLSACPSQPEPFSSTELRVASQGDLVLYSQPEDGRMAPSTLQAAPAKDDSHELAKKLQNPIASLISVPFQLNFDTGFGPKDADRATLNIQPVIPFSLNEEWNLITRTIVPVIYQDSLADGLSSDFGLGDTTQSFFFSPKNPSAAGSSAQVRSRSGRRAHRRGSAARVWVSGPHSSRSSRSTGGRTVRW